VGGNERKRECRECFLLFFLFYLLQYFFKKRDKREGVCGSGDGKKLKKCRESFFSVLIECVFILAPCNINAISALIVMNNIRKELVMIATHYVNQIIVNRAQNQSQISNINSNH